METINDAQLIAEVLQLDQQHADFSLTVDYFNELFGQFHQFAPLLTTASGELAENIADVGGGLICIGGGIVLGLPLVVWLMYLSNKSMDEGR